MNVHHVNQINFNYKMEYVYVSHFITFQVLHVKNVINIVKIVMEIVKIIVYLVSLIFIEHYYLINVFVK